MKTSSISSIVLLLLFIIAMGCSVADVTDDVLKKIHPRLDSIANSGTREATAGLLEQVDNDSVRINKILGRVMGQLQDSVTSAVVELKDAFLSDEADSILTAQIASAGKSVRLQADSLFQDASGQVSLLLDDAIAKVTDAVSIDKLQVARDSLMGPGFRALTDSLIRSAIKTSLDEFATSYSSEDGLEAKLLETLKKANVEAKEIGKQVSQILIIGGIVVAVLIALIGYFYVQGRRSRNTVQTLTGEIDKIPERAQYDELVGRVRQKMSEKGLSTHLDGILKKQKLYQQEEWKDKNKRLVDVLIASLKSAPDHESKSELLKRIRNHADKTGAAEDLQGAL